MPPALVVWSERFRGKGFPAFSYSLKALGTSIAYLSLWAASSVYHLAPNWLIFLAMTAVTLSNAVLARRQNSELLAMYALAGGLATPALLSMGHDSAIFLFSYLALLNAGALLLLALHPWKRMAWAALLGTAVYYIGWTLSEDDPSRLLVTGSFLGLFFAGFALAPVLILRQANAPGPAFPRRLPDCQCNRDVGGVDGAFRRLGPASRAPVGYRRLGSGLPVDGCRLTRTWRRCDLTHLPWSRAYYSSPWPFHCNSTATW